MTEIDHCAEWARLVARRNEIVEGESVQSDRHGSDEVRYAKADLEALDRQIQYHQAKCTGKRTRFAKPGVIRRPY